jgi:hypothetical protein
VRENIAAVRVKIAYELIERIAKLEKRYWSSRQCVERRHVMGASNVLLCDMRMEDDESLINYYIISLAKESTVDVDANKIICRRW